MTRLYFPHNQSITIIQQRKDTVCKGRLRLLWPSQICNIISTGFLKHLVLIELNYLWNVPVPNMNKLIKYSAVFINTNLWLIQLKDCSLAWRKYLPSNSYIMCSINQCTLRYSPKQKKMKKELLLQCFHLNTVVFNILKLLYTLYPFIL